YVTLFSIRLFRLFFFTRSSTLKLYSRSLHDALPISRSSRPCGRPHRSRVGGCVGLWSLGCGVDPSGSVGDPGQDPARGAARCDRDRKSTRLNSSHASISYAVFCLKKKKLLQN